ncbi:MAG: tetratricopeptide repeat protein [Planctomycetota bacterium]|jgi:tetratricopeptide (TPR) repeat protein
MKSGAWIGVGVVLALAVGMEAANADTLQLKDGRFFTFPKIFVVEGGYKIPFSNGDVIVPESMVLEAVILSNPSAYKPKNDEEKEKLEQGFVPYEGKWIKRKKFEKILEERQKAAQKRIEDLKKHQLWRNRYITKTRHFTFEYTLAPKIGQNYIDLMETYFKVFAKRFKVRQTPKTGGRLKVCFYHDPEYYYQVSGAPRGAIGYFRFVAPLELNFFYDRSDEDLTLDVLFHECNHYLVHLFNPNFVYPSWLAEGMAEYYGASHWNPEKKELKSGLLQEGRILVLKEAIDGSDTVGLEELIRLGRGGSGAFTGFHYAWAWSLVHMLMENKKYGKRFEKYFVHLSTGGKVKRVDAGYGKQTIRADEQIKLFKAFLGVKDLKKLEKEWHKYVKNLDVETGRGYFLAGNWACRYSVQLYHRAIRYYRTAIEKGFETGLLYDRLGSLLIRKEKEDEGIEALKKAVQFAPLNGRYTMHLGNALYEKGGSENKKEGIRLMRLAVEIDPEDVYLKRLARFRDPNEE